MVTSKIRRQLDWFNMLSLFGPDPLAANRLRIAKRHRSTAIASKQFFCKSPVRGFAAILALLLGTAIPIGAIPATAAPRLLQPAQSQPGDCDQIHVTSATVPAGGGTEVTLKGRLGRNFPQHVDNFNVLVRQGPISGLNGNDEVVQRAGFILYVQEQSIGSTVFMPGDATATFSYVAASGSVDCNSLPITILASKPTPVSQITTDGSTYCAVLSAGSGGGVKCWGENTSGELGVNPSSEPYSVIPVSVPGLSGVVSLASTPPGSFCALLSSGGIKCWGANSFGQLGDGSFNETNVPQSVEGITNASQLSADQDAFCAILTTGGVKCWGVGSQLGISTEPVPGSDVPVTVQGVSGATSLSYGGDASFCAVATGGQVKCWGVGGDLGNGTSSGSLIPVSVSGLTGATKVVGIDPGGPGTTTYCAVLSGGKVDCWGNQTLGNGTDGNSFVPVQVTGLTDATKLVGLIRGPSFCALQSTGGVKCWGYNTYGELGDGTTSGPESCGGPPCSTTPVAVSNLSDAVDLGGDLSSTDCVVLSNGHVECWGDEGVGELGNGKQIGPECPNVGCSDTPAIAKKLSRVIAVASGGDSNFCAALSTGGVDCWGSDAYGDLGNGTLTQFSDVPVAVVGIG